MHSSSTQTLAPVCSVQLYAPRVVAIRARRPSSGSPLAHDALLRSTRSRSPFVTRQLNSSHPLTAVRASHRLPARPPTFFGGGAALFGPTNADPCPLATSLAVYTNVFVHSKSGRRAGHAESSRLGSTVPGEAGPLSRDAWPLRDCRTFCLYKRAAQPCGRAMVSGFLLPAVVVPGRGSSRSVASTSLCSVGGSPVVEQCDEAQPHPVSHVLAAADAHHAEFCHVSFLAVRAGQGGAGRRGGDGVDTGGTRILQ